MSRLTVTGARMLIFPSLIHKELIMSNIGEFKKNESGFYIGSIVTLAVSMTLALREVNNPNPNAPRYEIHAKSASGVWFKVGALWEKVGSETGEAFLTGSIDDPSMDKTLYIACFMQADGNYAIAWSRPRRARSTVPGQASQDDNGGFDFEGGAAAPAKGKTRKSASTVLRADLGASTSDAANVDGVNA